jgi:hypothetical protein
MQDQYLFEYAVIRLVPRVEREEFLNIGVLLYCPAKDFLELRYHVDEAKARAFCPDTDLAFVCKQLDAFEAISRGGREGGAIARQPLSYRFRWLSANRSTIIQFSKVHPGFCENPERTLSLLFEKLVL